MTRRGAMPPIGVAAGAPAARPLSSRAVVGSHPSAGTEAGRYRSYSAGRGAGRYQRWGRV
jgi:hypothetical protein